MRKSKYNDSQIMAILKKTNKVYPFKTYAASMA